MATPDYTRPKGLLPKPRAKLQRVDITFSQSPTTTAIPRLVRMKRSEKSAHKAKAH